MMTNTLDEGVKKIFTQFSRHQREQCNNTRELRESFLVVIEHDGLTWAQRLLRILGSKDLIDFNLLYGKHMFRLAQVIETTRKELTLECNKALNACNWNTERHPHVNWGNPRTKTASKYMELFYSMETVILQEDEASWDEALVSLILNFYDDVEISFDQWCDKKGKSQGGVDGFLKKNALNDPKDKVKSVIQKLLLYSKLCANKDKVKEFVHKAFAGKLTSFILEKCDVCDLYDHFFVNETSMTKFPQGFKEIKTQIEDARHQVQEINKGITYIVVL